VIDILTYAVEHPIRRGIYNVGSGKARTFLDLVRAVFAAMDRPEAIEFIDTPIAIRERYQYFTEATLSKLRAAGYGASTTPLEAGVRETVGQLEAFSRRLN
jgi:ADP-L-glycero-D-manno-heptose 6-epimerase